jgi:hypothetical protein
MTAQQYVQVFDGAMHNPNVYRQWINSGTDIRKLNPAGVYCKHMNLRTLNNTQQSEPNIEGSAGLQLHPQLSPGMATA